MMTVAIPRPHLLLHRRRRNGAKLAMDRRQVHPLDGILMSRATTTTTAAMMIKVAEYQRRTR